MKILYSKNCLSWLISFIIMTALISCGQVQQSAIQVDGKNIRIEFNNQLHSRVIAKFSNQDNTLGDFSASEFVTIAGKDVKDFSFKTQKSEQVTDQIGTGKLYQIIGEDSLLRKEISIIIYDDFPAMAVFQVKYTNIGKSDLAINQWTNNLYLISAKNRGENEPVFWSYQSGSYESRPDWVLPLKTSFEQQNFMGMNASDYGGGTPVCDIWRKDVGIGVGHLELVPKLVSLPVTMPADNQANLGITFKTRKNLKPGQSLSTFRTFVAVHQGDCFQTLVDYRRMMIKQGVEFKEPPASAYAPNWCAWGYQRNFTMDQIYGTLPMVKKLGFEWICLDDGWQTSEGDWYLVENKYPNGSADMKKFVDRIHAEGLKAQLWWAPLAVDPGTDLMKNHPDYLLLNQDGSKQLISWWDAFYLCPADPDVQEYTKNLVIKIIKDWGYDGLKIDGQHLNAAPPCYNPAHHHAYPEESVEKVPKFFKVIYETALSIKPDALIQLCPCGTAYSFFTMPYFNQSVASDPESSWQIRLKGKTFKALMGASAAYFGDHVELSDGHNDFASTVGIGGVVGTKFTWPVGAKKNSRVDLTPEKEQWWQKWITIYREKMLSTGTYLGTLYDIGFDRPEAHAIQKDSNMYYAFYANHWQGEIELRGLEKKIYQVVDYVHGKDYGTVQGPVAKLNVEFEKFLLLEAKAE
jgi:alpha-galactosidase